MTAGPDPQIGLGRAIRKLRTDAELTQEEVALEAGLHPTWVSRLENGGINPKWGNVKRVAFALNTTLPELAALAEQIEQDGRSGDAALP